MGLLFLGAAGLFLFALIQRFLAGFQLIDRDTKLLGGRDEAGFEGV